MIEEENEVHEDTGEQTIEELRVSLGQLEYNHIGAKIAFNRTLKSMPNKTAKRVLRLITELEPEIEEYDKDVVALLRGYNTLVMIAKMHNILKQQYEKKNSKEDKGEQEDPETVQETVTQSDTASSDVISSNNNINKGDDNETV